MSDERLLRERTEVERLLRQLEPLDRASPSLTSTEEALREERFAALIDERIAALPTRRATLRRMSLPLLALAALALCVAGLKWGARGNGPAIEQEPLAEAPPPLAPPAPSVAVAPAPPPSSARPLRPSSSSAAPIPAPSTSAEPPQSTLAQENALFKEAAEASRAGDTEKALERLDRLLREHPLSPLAQTAQVRKFRLLVSAGRREEARQEAQRYLASHPTGFAVAEAESLLGNLPPAPSAPQPPGGP